MNHSTLSLSLVGLLSFGVACGGEATSPPAEPSAEPAPTPAPPANVEASGPRAEDESFTLEARPEEGGYTTGALGRFGIHIEGRGGWHLNHEFPVSVDVTAPAGVQLPRASLSKEDAAEFVDERARFDVPFTPSAAGEHEVQAVVSFAMCNPTSCVPKTFAVALALNVE
ncbi:MAG: hypothetical protein KF901_21905 [Myxococcales bacterium]|nr:hypothetical protein [Myxococcales bacterium]